MIDAMTTPGVNVVDFALYREGRRASAIKAQAIRALCRHCGAMLAEGDSDEDCSSAGLNAGLPAAPPRRMFVAE